MISFKDFQDDKGNIDWNAFRKAELEDGERCEKCGKFIFPGKGHRETCIDCKDLTSKSGEVTHEHFIRCPKCDHLENVHDDYYGLFQEGEHDVCCTLCDHSYTINTHVQFEFTSPPRVPKEEEVEEEDEEAIDDEAKGGA